MDKRLEDYLDWKSINTTRAPKVYPIWINYLFEATGKDPTDLTTADLAKFKRWLEDKHFKPASIKLAFSIVKNYFKFLILTGHKVLPQDLIKIPRGENDSHQPITEKEYRQLLTVIPVTDFFSLERHIIVRLLFETGMRVSELTSLNIDNITEEPAATITTKKNQKPRQVFWSYTTHDLLRLKYLPIRKAIGGESLFIGRIAGGGLSPRITTRSVERWVTEAVNKAGLTKKVVCHSFRHGWALQRLDKGAPITFVQKGLGHQNPASTFVYGNYADVDFEQKARGYLT